MRTSVTRPILAMCAATFAGAQASTAPATDRPNILWVVTEDNSAYTVGAYGDPLARTPNIDRLARDGIVFELAYAPAPVCAPCRSSIITGRYASGMGTQHMRSRRPLPEGVRFFPEYLREAGYYTTNNAKTDYNTSSDWSEAWDENSRTAHWRNRRTGQPFFAVFNFHESHESSLHKRQTLITDPAHVRVPAYLPDTPDVRADLAQYYDNVSRADEAIGGLLAQLAEDGLVEDTIIVYYGDHGGAVSRSKRFLSENSTHVPFIVKIPVKYRHLAPAAPGTRSDELVNLVDLAPTVLSLAGIPIEDRFHGRALLGAARTEAPSITFMFRDRMDERYDLSRAATDGRFRYIRNYHPERPWGQHLQYLWRQASMAEWETLHREGRLDATQRQFFEPKAPEELYDRQADPDNVRNLASDPAHKETLARFRSALRDHLLAIRDTGFIPEPMMIELAGAGSPAAVAADDRTYPIERILDFIDSQQIGSGANPEKLRLAFDAPEPVVRYWAAVLAARAPDSLDSSMLLKDPHASVRLTAAEAMLRHDSDSHDAWAAIESALGESSSRETQLFALNAIERLGHAIPGSLSSALVLLAEDPKPNEYVASAVKRLLAAR
ncbi:MAG TPA: sulfatase-like hydrolase/transferase [Opitutaceae bacterium]|nr:sulfatase-like hydrolase/transferase [Opitutaceae bacterium]